MTGPTNWLARPLILDRAIQVKKVQNKSTVDVKKEKEESR